ncbi:MAG TPA: hypothetical protein VF459_19655 [Caulobacteraceae bacterium]
MFSGAVVTPAAQVSVLRRQLDRRRRTLAIGASVVFHAVVLGLAVSSAGGALVTGGGAGSPEESTITVSLAGIAGSRQASTSPDEAQLQVLYRKALAEQSDLYAADQKPTAHSDLSKLFDAIEREHGGDAKQDGTTGQAKSGQQSGGGQQGKDRRLAEQASRSTSKAEGPGSAPSSGGLWGQIEPCWRRMPNQSAVPVKLEVLLDDKGMIAKPPRILRPDASVPDERRLIAEARALAAISACLPYKVAGLADDRRDFTLEFSPSAKGR